MNDLIRHIITGFIYYTIDLFVWDEVTLGEVSSGRYTTVHSNNIQNWEAGLFLYENAQNRTSLLQSKLASILTILSILIALFSLATVITSNFPWEIQLICIALSFCGIIYGLAPLFISKILFPDLDAFNKNNDFTPEIARDFEKSIQDIHQRSDFQADCIRTAATCIILSVMLYAVGTVMGLYIDSTKSKAVQSIGSPVNAIGLEVPAYLDSTKGPYVRLYQDRIIWLPKGESGSNKNQTK